MWKKISISITLFCASNALCNNIPQFEIKPLDAQWKAQYDRIEGTTHLEKSHNALTTLQMKSVAAIELWREEKALAETAKELYLSLDKEGQDLLLKTHAAWRTYIELHASLVTDGCRGGSARGLYSSSTIRIETKRRTKLYQELLSGLSPCKTGLSMYE
ncbi:hypothetical protein P4B35_02765 [Pontiellaceae bacterium B12227]|nr:hypothetical protein [Pontiellaceae bacterium B12227]